MPNEVLCMGCMQPISEFSDTCYHCGYPVEGENPEGYLRVRSMLSQRYLIGRALEKRSDAIVYIGYDKAEHAPVLVREFYPEGLCERGADGSVRPLSGKEVAFDDYLEKFRRQARVIARMRDLPAMLPVYDLFEENGVFYTVGDQVEGMPFRRYLQTLGGHLRWDQARALLMPLVSSLLSLHAAGLYHLGISPDSLLIDGENRLRIDGWSIADARCVGTALEAKLESGYAAPEQYREEQEVGQTADVYGLAATVLYALTGEEPPAAPDRINKTAGLLVPANLADQWPKHIAPTLCSALALDPLQRIPTMEQLRERLTVAPVVEALREDTPLSGNAENAQAAKRKGTGGYKAAIVLLVIVCVLLAGAIGWLVLRGNPFEQPAEEADTTPVVTTTTAPTRSTASQFAVEDVVGQTWLSLRERTLTGNMTVQVAGKQYSDTVPAGTVISQDPMPETYADVNSVVSVILSDGPQQKELPNVIGWERAAARTYLEALGYQVQEVEVTVSEYEAGRVDNLSPAVGSLLEEGDVVIMQVSNVPTTTVPITTTTRVTAR